MRLYSYQTKKPKCNGVDTRFNFYASVISRIAKVFKMKGNGKEYFLFIVS